MKNATNAARIDALLATLKAAHTTEDAARAANTIAFERWGAEGTDEAEAAWGETAAALDAACRAVVEASDALRAASPAFIGDFDGD